MLTGNQDRLDITDQYKPADSEYTFSVYQVFK